MPSSPQPACCRGLIPSGCIGGPTGGSACSSTGGRSASRRPRSVGRGPIPIRNARTRRRFPSRYTTISTRSSIRPKFNAKAVGGHRQGRRHEIHGADGQALRRVPAVGLEGLGLQHHAHAVQTRRLRGTGQGGARRGHENRLVLLADGLARPGLPLGAQRPIREAHAGGAARVADELRPDRSALVRYRRLARAVGPGGDLRDDQEVAAADRHRQPVRSRRPGQRPPPARRASARTPITTRRSSSSAVSTFGIPGNRA